MIVTAYNTPNWSPRTATPIYIAIHRMQGSFDGTVSWFQNPNSQVSADRCLSKDGSRVAIFNRVASGMKCWAVGNGNSLSVSIETEGEVGDEATLTDAFFDALAKQCVQLRDEIRDHYGNTVPLEHSTVKGTAGIVGHNQLAEWYGGSDHPCPGPNFPWARLEAAIARVTHPEYIEVTTGRGERRRFIIGKKVDGLGAGQRAAKLVRAWLKKGRKKITVTRERG